MNSQLTIVALLIAAGLIAPAATLRAQTTIDYTATAEVAVGNGDYTPYYLTSNRHSILSTKANTGYLRYAVTGAYEGRKMDLEWGADLQVSAHDYSAFYLQQLYVGMYWRWLGVEAGAREYDPVMRNRSLSSGSTVWSGNARPIPQIWLTTNDFIDIPGTRHWLQVYIDGGYGHYIDDDYQESHYATYTEGKEGIARSFLTTGVWYHQKCIFLRTDPDKRWVLTAGMEHSVQFGGTTNTASELLEGESTHTFKVKAKDFFKVLVPTSGDEDSSGGDQNFVYGNHLGNIQFTLTYNIADDRSLSFYVEDLFEDGSGMAKRNGWDGLWGLEFKGNEDAWLSGLVVEYLQTSDQSGPIHWAPTDWDDDIHASLPNEARGADDYYNNYIYNGYAHYGMAIGSPMLKSPRYNTDSYLRFTDTRVKAWHVGLSGALSSRWEYRILGSYRESWGTPFVPATELHHSFNAMLEATYHWRDWHFTAAYAWDRGNLYGDNAAANICITRSGRLLGK